MIRRRDDATRLITQTAHGWLSGQFAMHWGNEAFQFPALPQDVIMAAANHDNGWMVWEQTPTLNDRGHPIDFLEMPVATHVALWRQGIERLRLQNLYVALLVSMHGRLLVEGRLRNNDQDSPADKGLLEAFSAAQRAWEADIIAQLKTQPYFSPGCETHRLEANLRLLQVFDWFSLLLCMKRLSETVVIDVPAKTPNQRVELRLRPRGDRALTVTPWPFNRPAFVVTVQAHCLPQPVFESCEAFQLAWKSAKIEPLVFKVTG